MQTERNYSGKIRLSQLLYWFLAIYIPLLVIVVILLWLLYRTESNAALKIINIDEQRVIQLARQQFTSELSNLRSDLLYLSKHSSLQDWLASGRRAAKQSFADDLITFSRQKKTYDQLRYLDSTGKEVVRINWQPGDAYSVPADRLQDKSSRSYSQATLALDKNEVYISKLDLNIENGAIEQPIKPVLRLATPVFDNTGKKRGFFILNYLGQHLLERLKKIHSQHGGKLWLLSDKGHWLLGPSAEVEWGFVIKDRSAYTFKSDHPEAWKDIQEHDESGQTLLKNGLYTYEQVYSAKPSDSAESGKFYLVSHISTAQLDATLVERSQSLIVAFYIVAAILAVVSGFTAYYALQRRKVEAEIHESQKHYRGLLESAPDAIVIVDGSGKITIVNSQTEKWFGYQRDELIGKSIEVIIPKRFRGSHVTLRNEYIQQPTSRPMGADMELYALRKNGSEFPVEISLSPLETSKGLFITSSIRDITARKEAEKIQQQAEIRYQELVRNLPIGIYRKRPDPQGHFLEINPAMIELFEAASEQELLAHPVSELYVNPSDRQKLHDKLTREGYVKAEELQLKTLQGRTFYASITAVIKFDAENNKFFDGIIEDITSRKENENRIKQLNRHLQTRSIELEATNQELEAFSYSVSHDLRAPLRSMDGFSRTLLNEYTDKLDDKGKDRLNRIRNAAQRMATLIDDLLKLSRVTRSELNIEKVDLSSIASDAVDSLKKLNPERQVNTIIQPDLKTSGDARLLQIVMDNLLGNAWKFTSHQLDSTIEFGSDISADGTPYYFVRDNGAGYDMGYADKLFGAFQRLHDHHEFPGTGIGLATVQRIIRRHGGRIWAEGEINKGATFYFTLNGIYNNE